MFSGMLKNAIQQMKYKQALKDRDNMMKKPEIWDDRYQWTAPDPSSLPPLPAVPGMYTRRGGLAGALSKALQRQRPSNPVQPQPAQAQINGSSNVQNLTLSNPTNRPEIGSNSPNLDASQALNGMLSRMRSAQGRKTPLDRRPPNKISPIGQRDPRSGVMGNLTSGRLQFAKGGKVRDVSAMLKAARNAQQKLTERLKKERDPDWAEVTENDLSMFARLRDQLEKGNLVEAKKTFNNIDTLAREEILGDQGLSAFYDWDEYEHVNVIDPSTRKVQKAQSESRVKKAHGGSVQDWTDEEIDELFPPIPMAKGGLISKLKSMVETQRSSRLKAERDKLISNKGYMRPDDLKRIDEINDLLGLPDPPIVRPEDDPYLKRSGDKLKKSPEDERQYKLFSKGGKITQLGSKATAKKVFPLQVFSGDVSPTPDLIRQEISQYLIDGLGLPEDEAREAAKQFNISGEPQIFDKEEGSWAVDIWADPELMEIFEDAADRG